MQPSSQPLTLTARIACLGGAMSLIGAGMPAAPAPVAAPIPNAQKDGFAQCLTSASPDAHPGRQLTVNMTSAPAASLQTLRYDYRPDAAQGDGAGIRIEIPVAYAETESLLFSPPQTAEPQGLGYAWATTSTGAKVDVTITGVLGGIIQATLAAPLAAGETLSVFYRGRVRSVAGKVDIRYATKAAGDAKWQVAPRFPALDIEPARARFLAVHFPSDVVAGQPFEAAIVAIDRFGNLATGYTGSVRLSSTDPKARIAATAEFTARDHGRVVVPVTFNTNGFQKIEAAAQGGKLPVRYKYAWVQHGEIKQHHLFGDLHFHTGSGAANQGLFTVDSGQDLNTTGTNTFKELNLAGDHRANFTNAVSAYCYALNASGLDFASTSEHASRLLTDHVWQASQDISDSFYRPGRFSTFYGFEWTPELNHYIVMYKDRAGKPFDHIQYPDYPALHGALKRQGAPVLTMPHVSWPFPNHDIWQDEVSNEYRPIGEMYSLWNGRHLVQPDDEPQLFETPADAQWSYQYAWKKGFRIGVTGASDNHLGQPGANNDTIDIRHSGGLAGVVAPRNDRDAIWNALGQRTAYATTGTQIYLDFSSGGHPMGSEYTTGGKPGFAVRVAGTNKLALVEIVRLQNGEYQTVYQVRPDGETSIFEFTDNGFQGDAMYYLRVRQVEEYPGRLYSHSTADMAWSSPIWISRN
ncbi:DUF3604 domain-containing protein [Sphingomonas canadensis]|uniref:DUF3604 domain-containing protein n=1 Tax=Sphingomonas canadensis TaxID=1219257 RepID=A0ABW3HF87_9SPHN|nr:DUF3604 domain-containing protein [Sphingomonas canadensis]MCW3838110.1 DUF3604 domain-containing protein [Sphingomonas canadensis]